MRTIGCVSSRTTLCPDNGEPHKCGSRTLCPDHGEPHHLGSTRVTTSHCPCVSAIATPSQAQTVPHSEETGAHRCTDPSSQMDTRVHSNALGLWTNPMTQWTHPHSLHKDWRGVINIMFFLHKICSSQREKNETRQISLLATQATASIWSNYGPT